MSTTYVAEYAAMITTVEETPRVIILDCINESSVTATSTLTSHPTVLGDNVGDHMYREPISYGLSGVFATNGSQGLVIEGEKPSLQDMQSIFEEIKNKGILCEIVRIKVDGPDRRPTFQVRHSMALTSITWREQINSLAFNFTFNEVLQAEIEEFDVDKSDENLPNVTSPNNLSFTDALIDWDQVDKAIVAICEDEGLITQDFKQFAMGFTASALIAIGIGAVVAKIVVAATSAIPIVGQIIFGITAVVMFAICIQKICEKIEAQRKFRIQIFDASRDAKKNEAEMKRFANLVSGIHEKFYALNDKILVKQMSSNEEQEVIVTIGDSFYTFTFLKNNTSGKYAVDIKYVAETEINVKTGYDVSASPTNWYDCNGKNRLFVAENTGEEVYMIFNGEESERNDLTKYYIVISSIDPEEFNNLVTDLIKEAILY